MKQFFPLAIALAVLLAVFISGCSASPYIPPAKIESAQETAEERLSEPSAAAPTPQQLAKPSETVKIPKKSLKPAIKTYKGDLASLALQASDFPSNFTLMERAERTKSDVAAEALNLGWQGGYYARYAKIGDLLETTVIEQAASIYPPENLSMVFSLLAKYFSETNLTLEPFSDPKIGDRSQAYKISYVDEDGEPAKAYYVVFAKMNVYETIELRGTGLDYELLKTLAKKAAEKVR